MAEISSSFCSPACQEDTGEDQEPEDDEGYLTV